MSNTAKNIIMAIVIIICLFLLITGQKTIGMTGLVKELVGVAGMLVVLWSYNRRYK